MDYANSNGLRACEDMELDQVTGGFGPFAAFFTAFVVTDILIGSDEGVQEYAYRVANEQKQKKQQKQ